jgi:hypothetical protein
MTTDGPPSTSSERKANAALRDEVRNYIDRINTSLPSLIHAGGLTLKSKLPWKAQSLREVLMHRLAETATGALAELDAARDVSFAILTRATMETFSLFFSLDDAIAKFLADGDVEKLDQFLMTGLMGWRTFEEMPKAIQILKCIDLFDKKSKGFRHGYDMLSEIAHPNWAGTLGSFAVTEKFELHLGKRGSQVAETVGLNMLAATLDAFILFYNENADRLDRLNGYFEQQS